MYQSVSMYGMHVRITCMVCIYLSVYVWMQSIYKPHLKCNKWCALQFKCDSKDTVTEDVHIMKESKCIFYLNPPWIVIKDMFLP